MQPISPIDDSLEGIPREQVLAHRDSCPFCQEQLSQGAEGLFRALRHILRFFKGPKDFLEPCSR